MKKEVAACVSDYFDKYNKMPNILKSKIDKDSNKKKIIIKKSSAKAGLIKIRGLND